MSIPKRDKTAAQAKMSKSLFGGAGTGFGLPAQTAKKAPTSADPALPSQVSTEPVEGENLTAQTAVKLTSEEPSTTAAQYRDDADCSELTQKPAMELTAPAPSSISAEASPKIVQDAGHPQDSEPSKGPTPRIQRSQTQRFGAERGLSSRYKRPITLRLPADVADMLESKIDALEARSLNQLLVVLLQSATDSPDGLAPFVKTGPITVSPGASIKERARALLAAQGGKRPDDIQQISLRLPSDLGAKINRAAKSVGKKLSPFLIEAISSLAQTL